MIFLREIARRRAEISGLKSLLVGMPDDPLAKPLLTSRIDENERELADLEKNPPCRPEAELLFAGGPVFGSAGIDAKFAANVLDSYQDMVANHYSASRHGGIVGSRGPRKGEEESRLCLSALPRGSFGLKLEQPKIENFIDSAQLADIMDQITSILESAASGDAAFTDAVEKFHPRVLAPLEHFLSALESNSASVRVRSGSRECELGIEQVKSAKKRVSGTKPETRDVQMRGICRGVLLESWKFDFNPDGQLPISGQIAKDVPEEAAKAMLALAESNTPAEAYLKVTRMKTLSAYGKPTYELTQLTPLEQLGQTA
jgi:hypothetical protein